MILQTPVCHPPCLEFEKSECRILVSIWSLGSLLMDFGFELKVCLDCVRSHLLGMLPCCSHVQPISSPQPQPIAFPTSWRVLPNDFHQGSYRGIVVSRLLSVALPTDPLVHKGWNDQKFPSCVCQNLARRREGWTDVQAVCSCWEVH